MYQKYENEPELRRFFIQNYVIIYKIEKNYILLIRILPSKSNYIQEGIYKKQFPKNKVIK
jgi:mRNA-degrading endonuclease RelE of RelBE toxin-antitoxin system